MKSFMLSPSGLLLTASAPYTFNLLVAWVGILLGLLSGTIIGLFFHQEGWLEGYSSWQRRMLRLGHISFFGIALLNFAFVFSASSLEIEALLWMPSACFAIAEFAMPFTCFASAFWKPARFLFPLPVIALLTGTLLFLTEGILA
jgi:hypothetical protein